MKATKYLSTMMAVAGISLGAPALAEEYDGNPKEAFQVGLQSHGASAAQINFAGGHSTFNGSSQLTALNAIEYATGTGYGADRCITTNGRGACSYEQAQAYVMYNKLEDPDFADAAIYGGDSIVLDDINPEVDLAPGEYPGVVSTGSNTKINFVPDPDPNIPSLYFIKKISTGPLGEIHLVAGDYFIETLEMGANSKIIVDGEGTARLYLKKSPSLDSFTHMNWLSGCNATQEPSKLVIFSKGSFDASNHASMAAYVYATGDFSATDTSKLVGAVNAQSINLWSQAQVIENLTQLESTQFGDHLEAYPAPEDYQDIFVEPPELTGLKRHSGTYTLDWSSVDDVGAPWEKHVTYNIHGGIAVVGIPSGVVGFWHDIDVRYNGNSEPSEVKTELFNQLRDALGFFADKIDSPLLNADPEEDADGNLVWTHPWFKDDTGSKIKFYSEQSLIDAKESQKLEVNANIENLITEIENHTVNIFKALPEKPYFHTKYSQFVPKYGFSNYKGTVKTDFKGKALLVNNRRFTIPDINILAVTPPTPWAIPGVIGGGFMCGAWTGVWEAGCFNQSSDEPYTTTFGYAPYNYNYTCKYKNENVNSNGMIDPGQVDWETPDVSMLRAANGDITCGGFTIVNTPSGPMPINAFISTLGIGIYGTTRGCLGDIPETEPVPRNCEF